MTRRYSALSLFKEGVAGQTGWKQAWRSPEPKPAYDAIVIGGGEHGLATAYYLAKNHNIARVAVLEKGWIGGGNTGRSKLRIHVDRGLAAYLWTWMEQATSRPEARA
nr:FAD-dependent oxidoreductase [Mesorhizobium sp. B283B1A]